MDQNIKNKWIEALRSGKYIQGIGSLKQEIDHKEMFCCIGVLCDIVDESKWDKRIVNNRNIWKYNNKNDSYPYNTYSEITTWDGISLSTSIQNDLIHMNDTGKSFEEIADWIEKNL